MGQFGRGIRKIPGAGLAELGALEDGQGQLGPNPGRRFRILQEPADGGQSDATEVLKFVAQGQKVLGASLPDRFRELLFGIEPVMDGAAMDAGGLGGRSDGNALSEGERDLLLERRERRSVRGSRGTHSFRPNGSMKLLRGWRAGSC